ncbi:MAG: helix-turn-helix domain-containing protein, partial [Thermoleophilaceae bacterium]
MSELSEQQRARALARHTTLRPHLENGVPLARAAAAAAVPLRTAERWLALYRRGGLAALAPATRRDRGRRRFPDDLVALIEGMALRRPAPSIAHVHRQATT